MKKLLLLLLAVGCAPQPARVVPGTPDPNPDILLVSISGKCGPLCPAGQNWDYLREEGSDDLLATHLRGLGRRVLTLSAAASALTSYQSPRSFLPQHGYPWLRTQLATVTQQYPQADIILLGHSHGSVLAHQLVLDFPNLAFSLLIDLDSQCLDWTYPGLDTACRKTGGVYPHDLVPDNVLQNIEIQASDSDLTGEAGGLTYAPLRDRVPNRRTDHTRRGITTLTGPDNHVSMTRPYSATMQLLMPLLTRWAHDRH